MRYFIRLSYNGSAFCGWQIQDNANSVQEEIQKALSTLLREHISVTGAGRTDSGVNAVNYIAHFDSQTLIQNAQHTLYKLNAILPGGICIYGIFMIHEDAHARFDAVSRTYKYFIHTIKDPFNSNFSYFIPPGRLDFEKMNRAAKYFLGERDFSSLEKVNGGNKTSICNVTEAYWRPVKAFPDFGAGHTHLSAACRPGTEIPATGSILTGNEQQAYAAFADDDFSKATHFVFTVTANRFLRNMVRAMVGSLLEVGTGKQEPEWIEQMLAKKNRSAAGHSVPGNALFLYNIEYPYKQNF